MINNHSNPKSNEFDPFANRKLRRPTTDTDTLIHLLKSVLGSGILSMPFAFKKAGVFTGIFLVIIVYMICVNCAYILVKSAHKLYKKTKQTQMTYSEVAFAAFNNGPNRLRKYASLGRFIVMLGLFSAYFGTCSVYSTLIAQNTKQVIEQYTESRVNIRVYIAALIIPTILLCWIPDFKSLAIASLISNILMAISLGITSFYIYSDFVNLDDVNLVSFNIAEWPVFISITIFAMEATGISMSLENNMKTPQHFLGFTGVLQKAMFIVTSLYASIGVFGYMTYGSKTNANISYEIPTNFLGNSSRIMISLAVLLTFVLLFFVCLEIVWNSIKHKFPDNQTFYNYVTRTVLVILAISIAILIPNIEPLISLISAVCFSVLGLLMPAIIETLVFWDDGCGLTDWRTYKNLIIGVFSVNCFVLGTKNAIDGIYKEYFHIVANNVTNF